MTHFIKQISSEGDKKYLSEQGIRDDVTMDALPQKKLNICWFLFDFCVTFQGFKPYHKNKTNVFHIKNYNTLLLRFNF